MSESAVVRPGGPVTLHLATQPDGFYLWPSAPDGSRPKRNERRAVNPGFMPPAVRTVHIEFTMDQPTFWSEKDLPLYSFESRSTSLVMTTFGGDVLARITTATAMREAHVTVRRASSDPHVVIYLR